MAQWEEELASKEVCASKIANLDEALSSPLLRDRQMVFEFPDEKGNPTPTLGVSVKLGETPGSVRKPPPSFGGNTEKILRELGYAEEEIACFSENGVV